MKIRHVLVDDDSVVLVPGTVTVFHHRACFAHRHRGWYFILRRAFYAWRWAIAHGDEGHEGRQSSRPSRPLADEGDEGQGSWV